MMKKCHMVMCPYWKITTYIHYYNANITSSSFYVLLCPPRRPSLLQAILCPVQKHHYLGSTSHEPTHQAFPLTKKTLPACLGALLFPPRVASQLLPVGRLAGALLEAVGDAAHDPTDGVRQTARQQRESVGHVTHDIAGVALVLLGGALLRGLVGHFQYEASTGAFKMCLRAVCG